MRSFRSRSPAAKRLRQAPWAPSSSSSQKDTYDPMEPTSSPERRTRDKLYKNRSSRKTDFQKEKRSSGSPILLNIVSENQFSGKTLFYTIASRMIKARAVNPVGVACTVIGVLGVNYNGYQLLQWM